MTIRFVLKVLWADLCRISGLPRGILVSAVGLSLLAGALLFIPGFWQDYASFIAVSILASPIVLLYEDMLKPRGQTANPEQVQPEPTPAPAATPSTATPPG